MSDKYTNAERIHDYIYDLKPVINVGDCFPMVLNTIEYRRSLESMTR